MINRYQLWLDTLNVIPTGPETCTVHIDYWVKKDRVRLALVLAHHCSSKGSYGVRDLGELELSIPLPGLSVSSL